MVLLLNGNPHDREVRRVQCAVNEGVALRAVCGVVRGVIQFNDEAGREGLRVADHKVNVLGADAVEVRLLVLRILR
jgi:hypothetical protein